MNIPSGFAIGQLGEWRDKWMRVCGRVRWADGEGFWDEWCLEFSDGAVGWLEHEEGQDFITLKKKLLSPVPPWQNIRVGQVLSVNGEPFFVTEKARAVITAWEGQLPYPIQGGEQFLFADGNINGQIASLEWGRDAIELGIGHAVERGDLNFQIPSL